jgi:hypothetical protein
MKKNMGTADRLIRVLAAVVVGALYMAGLISGPLAIVLGLLAVVFLVTSSVSSCPLYLPFNISTKGGAS